jgi:sugar phosphate isomerase/epimerase
VVYTRRDIGKIALAGIPAIRAMRAFGATMIDSKINGVQIGAITYSFNRIANEPEAIIRALVEIGIGDTELMSNHAEALAGAPSTAAPRPAGGGFGGPGMGRGPGAPAQAGAQAGGPPAGAGPAPGAAPGGRQGGGRGQMTPEQQAAMQARQEELRKWRAAANDETWKALRKKFNDAGINVGLLCYNMRDNMSDEDIDYGFRMARGLGVNGLTTSTTVSMSKRIAPFADKYKLLVGYHGHDQTNDPNEFATLDSYAVGMSYGKYNGINLDIGHFTASNYDAVAYIKQYHEKITNIHIKDRKKDHGPNVPWGQGDTPLKEVLQLIRTEKYPFPANIELEYPVPPDSTVVAEMKKCFDYVKKCLA